MAAYKTSPSRLALSFASSPTSHPAPSSSFLEQDSIPRGSTAATGVGNGENQQHDLTFAGSGALLREEAASSSSLEALVTKRTRRGKRGGSAKKSGNGQGQEAMRSGMALGEPKEVAGGSDEVALGKRLDAVPLLLDGCPWVEYQTIQTASSSAGPTGLKTAACNSPYPGGLNLSGLSVANPCPAGNNCRQQDFAPAQSPALRKDSPASRSGNEPVATNETATIGSSGKASRKSKFASAQHKVAKQVFQSYATAEEVKIGLANGLFEQGVLVVSPKSREQAYVRIPGKENEDVNVSGDIFRNRAFSGDVVVVEILPRLQWKVRPERIEDVQAALGLSELSGCTSTAAIQGLIEEHRRKSGVSPRPDGPSPTGPSSPKTTKKSVESRNQGQKWMDLLKDNIGIDAVPEEWLQKTGKVIYVDASNGVRQLIGTLGKVDKQVPFMLVSSDCRMPNVLIRKENIPTELLTDLSTKKDLKSSLFVVEVIEWLEHVPLPYGRVVKNVGKVGDISSFTATILVENGINEVTFPVEDLNKLIKSFKKRDADTCYDENRHDFRNDCVFTIDPPDAKDLDDAVSCSDLGNGIFQVCVHIADVSFFVREGSPLDVYARQRGTTVYLVNKVVPMLPQKLIEACCSLDPGKDRRTISVIFTITDHGEILECHLTRGLIRSRAKLSYRTAQDIIDAPERVSAVSLGVSPMEADAIRTATVDLHEITQVLRRERFRKGGLRIDQPEFLYDLDEKGLPIAMVVREHWESCQLIEELALLTNMVSARLIYQNFPEIALLRRHPAPLQSPLNHMRKLCELEKMEMKTDGPRTIHASMCAIAASRPDLLPVLSYLCAKPMKLAEYICTGMELDTWHYALNVEQYTHMTSPIRRYPDIIVHRLLLAALGYNERPAILAADVHEIATQCNVRKLAAGRCQEASLNLYMGLFIQRFGALVEDGIVVAVYGANLSVDILALRLAFVQRVFCGKVPGVKRVSHRLVGMKHVLDLFWAGGNVVQTLGVWSPVRISLSVCDDVRNIKMFIYFPGETFRGQSM